MFKRSIIFILLTAILLCALPVYGAKDGIEPNEAIYVNGTEPLIDGEVKTGEGWSEPAVMEDRTLGYILNGTEAGFYAEVYFAASERGFYFGANILEDVVSYDPDGGYASAEDKNMFVASTGEDNAEDYTMATGWNGDTFILCLDPMGCMTECGFTGEQDYAPGYAVSLFEDGRVRVYRERVNAGEITEDITVFGKQTTYGWCFEACIPWDIIIRDIADITFGEIELDKDKILHSKNSTRASAIYCDRYIDAEGNIADLNHYVTSPSADNAGYNIPSMGLELVISAGLGLGDAGICTPTGHDWVFDLFFDATYTSTGFGINQCSVCGKTEYVTIPKKPYTDAFVDVKSTHWYYDAVNYCLRYSYMVGVSSDRFSPLSNLTREQFVMILANYEGVDTDAYKNVDSGMKDVIKGSWYSGAVAWAVEEGYVCGIAPGVFGTGQPIERAALVRLLMLYTATQGVDVSGRADLSVYADAANVQEWMREGLEWAVYNGLISSTSDYYMHLAPKGKVTRGMAAVMIMNYDEYMYDRTYDRS